MATKKPYNKRGPSKAVQAAKRQATAAANAQGRSLREGRARIVEVEARLSIVEMQAESLFEMYDRKICGCADPKEEEE